MTGNDKYVKFKGRLVFVGFGCVGQGVLPLLLRHIDIAPEQILIFTADERGRAEADHYGIKFSINPLTPANYREILVPVLSRGDFLLNVSIDVSSAALIEFCHERGALYLDTCIEPWAGGYTDTGLSPSRRSNYGLREGVLAVRQKFGSGPTAVVTHGANPGLISHWVKQALLDIARDTGVVAGGAEGTSAASAPASRDEWAGLARALSVKVIHCAERDTQVANPPKRIGEFVNTWSVDAFVGEGCQPAELGWGSHEMHSPVDGRHHDFGCDAAIFLERPGVATRVRSWTPRQGAYQGFLITHGESISIADYLTVMNSSKPYYRPTVHYAYHPCDGALLSVHELNGRSLHLQPSRRVLMNDIDDGTDELGALLMGHARGAYWYGSALSIQQARKLAPYNNATSLQVAAGVLGAVVWALENPAAGIVEPDEMPFGRVLEVAAPYLGEVLGQYSDWTPLAERGVLFEEDVDRTDPWQFKNFRVS